MYVENEEFCTLNEELCIKMEELCIEMDEFCSTAAVNHSKHEVAAQGKTIMAAATAQKMWPRGAPDWGKIPCDIMHQQVR